MNEEIEVYEVYDYDGENEDLEDWLYAYDVCSIILS